MNKSEDIKDLAKALSLAQAQIKGAKADSVNPFYKSTYADLSSVWDAIRKPFTDNGLSVAQLIEEQEKFSSLTTILIHSSGQWLSSTFQIRTTKNDPQGFVAGVTYARRTALSAISGVAEIDDDGNEAAGKPTPIKTAQDAANPMNYFEKQRPDVNPNMGPEDDFPAFDKFPEKKEELADETFEIGKKVKGQKFSETLKDPSFLIWVNETLEKDYSKAHPQLKRFHKYAMAQGAYKL